MHPTTLNDTLLALADPTRRAILNRLAAGEARVTDLARPFAMSLNSVSKHIRILERARLVRRRRAGREHLLSIDPAPLDEAAQWLATQRASWNAQLDALDALLQADGAAAKRPKPQQRRARTRRGRRETTRRRGTGTRR